jgi:hypothetical protein
VVKYLKEVKLMKKDCFDDFIVGFGFGVGRVPLVASPLRLKMRGLLNSQLSFSNFRKY